MPALDSTLNAIAPMPATLNHLEFLLGSSKDVNPDQNIVEDWLTGPVSLPPINDDYDYNGESEGFDTVLALEWEGTGLESSRGQYARQLLQYARWVLTVISEPTSSRLGINWESLVPIILHSLDIENDLVELIGYEHIDLAMDIIANRNVVQDELKTYLHLNSEPQRFASQPKARSPEVALSSEAARWRIEEQLRTNAARPLFSGTAQTVPEELPHVYSSMGQGTVLSHTGSKYLLPLGTERHHYEEYEEVIVPPAKPVPPKGAERIVSIQELDALARGCFPGYTSLNRVQSILYQTTYHSNENLLVCAPTGAGKTDIAMLAILRVLKLHQKVEPGPNRVPTVDRNSFKIIYVAPMKALASEVVRKLSKRLKWLSVSVRELTGDMQMTKAEIAETQIIVTTPEKWDVVTRKPTGEGELASLLKLLIIDEVHLLNDERGAVIETIVARTLRQVESSQSLIRIVGLSATLPNYVDVAEFLSASKYKGLFYFDSSFRPIPLEQHFIGIKGKPGSAQSKKNLDQVTFEKVSQLVSEGHQVMVFVHARKETVKSALGLRDMATEQAKLDDFSCQDHPQWSIFRREIGQSRNKEMRQLFDSGFGIHHAGMLRSDRNMMERMFEARAIKVLCCTATLAWGVNLPAHAVIIKGTQVYDSSKGSFVDLSVLDVLQIFGRAGRPGLETSGEGYICTSEDKLAHYLDVVTAQHPIESQFHKGIVDALNAEISLGTVASIDDAVRWLGYTYLFVRMRKNPFLYGIGGEELSNDPQLVSRRIYLVTSAAQRLADVSMVNLDRQKGTLSITSLGRIAAKYYIRYSSIQIYNEKFRPTMSEADVLAMLSMSSEFDQIQLREEEREELTRIREIVPCEVKGIDTNQDKVNILLQGYISKVLVDDFALVSDTAYAAQNGGRIIRALLEIAISKKWANASAILIGLSKAIEKQIWPIEHPLVQFPLKNEVLYGLREWADDYSVAELAKLDAATLGQLVHQNELQGAALLKAAKQFPALRISYTLRPLGYDVLRITILIQPLFIWSIKVHGTSEPFWVWVEDHEGINILQSAYVLIRQTTSTINLDFVISIPNGVPPPAVYVRSVSDKWVGAEEELEVSLESLKMPSKPMYHTTLLDVPLLNMSVLNNAILEQLFPRNSSFLNSMQTQALWALMNTPWHSLLCAPTGSGKSVLAQVIAVATALRISNAWVLIVVPRRSVAGEFAAQLRGVANSAGISILLGSTKLESQKGKTIQIITVKALLQYFTRGSQGKIINLHLTICESLEQMDSSYELGVSLLRHATQSSPTRFVGFSGSLLDPVDLADWLNVEPSALFSFRPRDRDQSLALTTQTFTIPHSASLFKAMAKPAHTAIQSAGPGQAAIVFVPSRGYCASVARDLITQCTLETESSRGYLPADIQDDLLEVFSSRIQDRNLLEFVFKGVGFFHEGIHRSDRNFMLELFAEGAIRVLLIPRESCWTVPVRAAVVVVMGTQYMSGEGPDRQLKEYALTELVQMQGRAVRHSSTGHFHLFCQAETKDTLTRFLDHGLPLESELLDTQAMAPFINSLRSSHRTSHRQDIVDVLSYTFLARRVSSNPTYYDKAPAPRNEVLSQIADQLLEQSEMSDEQEENTPQS
ncbi:hypothetical protein AX16_000089 [Volvariella volvacea WC 439]|nr:hypothetical protein AX16_000089 [Volvariella volvacea WC 439]